jgi:hypothetical protein
VVLFRPHLVSKGIYGVRMSRRNNKKRRNQKTMAKAKASSSPEPVVHSETDLPREKHRGKRLAVLFLTVILPLSVATGAYIYPHFHHIRQFRVALAAVGNLELEFDHFQQHAISPACGCFSPEPELWRGIEFWSADMTLQSDRKLNRFSISSPAPAPVTRAGFFPMSVRLLSIPRYSNDDLAMTKLIQAEYSPPSATTTMVFDGVRSADLIFTGSLRIRLQGTNATVAAWIPASGSKIRLMKSQEPLTGEFSRAQLDDISSASAESPQDEVNYPTLDLVAEHVVLEPLDDSSPIYFFSGGSEHMVTLNPPNARNRVILVIDSFFSTRVSMGSITEKEILVPGEHPSKTHIDPTFFSEHDVLPPSWTPATEHSYKLRIDDAFTGHEEYDAAIAKLRKNDTVGLQMRGGGWMGMRYPPMPATRGFTLFGNLGSWQSNNTTGNVQVGGSSTQLGVPSLIEIRNIEGLDLQHLGIIIPFSAQESQGSSLINMAGKGTVLLDRTEINGFEGFIGSLVMWVGLVGTFLGVCFAIYPLPLHFSPKSQGVTVGSVSNQVSPEALSMSDKKESAKGTLFQPYQ